jgi:WD40 repeat protein
MLTLEGHRSKVRALAFSPESRRLATVAGREQRVSLWELPGGLRSLSPGKAAEVQTLTFTPDGSGVVIASDRYLRRWDIAAGSIQDKWLRAANYCRGLAFSPDGSLLAAACYSRWGHADRCRADLFRTTALPEKTFLVGDFGTPHCLAFSPDSRYLAMGGDYKLLRVWNVKEEEWVVTWKFSATVHAVAFSPDGTVAAVAAGSTVTLHDTATRKQCGELAGHVGEVCALCFAPNGSLLSGGDDGTVRFWDVSARRERAAFDWKVGPVRVASCSLDGMLAAVGGDDGLVVWDLE